LCIRPCIENFAPQSKISPQTMWHNPIFLQTPPGGSFFTQKFFRMDYTRKYFELKQLFKTINSSATIDDSAELKILQFTSENYWDRIFKETEGSREDMLSLGMPDSHFTGNNHFTYPVIVPRKEKMHSKAIILLHGLNERFWDKYLPWAYYLALYTNRPVILFPLSFHMNRAPEEWSNPKVMAPFIDARKKAMDTADLTFVNLALSCRLTSEPLRFMRSGHQSAADLIQLTQQMERGEIPLFKKGTRPDFFAYSIGAFVSQILLLANPDGMFTDTRFFLFCGGSFFKDMYGVSRMIMDKAAFERINTFYTSSIDEAVLAKKTLAMFLDEYKLGKAFYSMLKEENNREFREDRFLNASKNILSLALTKDKVIPPTGIKAAFGFDVKKSFNVEEMDFPFDYCHESPFPISGKMDKNIVDYWFGEVFTKVAGFFN
jgi:hypothetical protein